MGHLNFRLPNDATAHVHVNWLAPSKIRRTIVGGSRKMLVYDDMEPSEKVRIYDKGVDCQYETDQFTDFHLQYRYGGVNIPYVPFQEPLRVQCEHFLASIRTGTRPQSDFDARAVFGALEESSPVQVASLIRTALEADGSGSA